VVLFAAIDIHKHVFQAAVLDPESGEVVEERFSADRESLARWTERWRDQVEAVAIEATTGWRWVWRQLAGQGFDQRRDYFCIIGREFTRLSATEGTVSSPKRASASWSFSTIACFTRPTRSRVQTSDGNRWRRVSFSRAS
jgi:hypothetical protein